MMATALESAYSKALHCLLENLHDCHFLGEEATRTALIGVTKIARHYGCTTDMRSPCDEELCAKETMNACYRLLDINNTETLDEICMQLDRVDACIHAAVEFCPGSVKRSRSVRLLVERKEYNCPVPPSYPECQEHIATECIIVYEQQIVNLPQVAKCVMYTSVRACILEAMSMCVKEDEGHEVSIGVIDEAKKKLLNVLGSCRTLPKFQFSNTDHKILLEEGQPGQSVCFSLAQDIGEVCSDGHCAVQLKYELIEDRSNVLYCSKHNEISQVLVSGSCGLIFTVENWNEDQCFVLTPTMDRKKDGDHTAMFKLNAELIVNGQMVMSSQVREYQLTVVDRDTVSQCSASNGHITTFDGYSYDYKYHGEYLLYGHVGGPYQVWATSSECSEGNTHGSCICEAGVKCGDDMFVINHCYKEKKDKMKPTLWQNHELTSGCRIYRGRGGRSYRVELPHGTSVEIKIERKDKKKDKKARLLDYLKIVINPSTADFLNTEGLCGTYDGNLLNDLTALNGDVYNPADIPVFKSSPKKKLKPRPDAFSRSWRTEIFTEYHLVGVSPNPFDPVLLKFCRPGGDTCVCSDRSTPVNYCELNRKGKWQDVTNSLSIKSKVKSNRKSRRKRQTSTDFTDLLVDSNFVPELPTFPTSNGITFEMANETCYDALTGAAFHNICSNVISEDQQLQLLKDKLDNCVSDILENEGATWYVKSSVDDYRDKCMLFAESSPDYTIIVDLDSFTCDNDCSGHGACVNDVCICTADYGSYDCSINVNDAPTVDSLDGTMCEPTVNDTCDLVTVYGDNFIENGNVSCHIEVVQVSDNGITKSGNNFTVPATFENYNMITCDISQAGSQLLTAVLISASNNGLVTNASAQHLFIVYDSVCWECNVDQQDGNCQRHGGCVVDDVCYASLAPSPSDACLLCDAWNDTLRYSESCPSTTTADGVTTKGATTAGATTAGVTTAGATTAGATTADATTTEPSARTGSSSTNDATVIGVAAGVAGFILLLIAILACFFVMRQRKQIERRYASKREYSDRRSGESPEIVPGYVNEVYTVYPDYFETPDAVFAGSMPKRHSSRQPDGTTQYNNQHDAKNPRASHT